MNLLRNFSIRTRIVLGFTTAFVLLGVISGLQYFSSKSVNSTMQEVVEERQPQALTIKTASATLQNAASQLGFFSATGEPALSKAFDQAMNEVKRLVADYGDRLSPSDPERITLTGILSGLDQFRRLGDRIIELRGDRESNFPGIAFANDQVNPVTLRMNQQAAGLLSFEISDGPADGEQAERMGVYSDLRDALSNTMRGIRGYLAFRTAPQKDNTLTFLARAEELIERIGTWSHILTFEQEEYLDGLRQGLADLRPGVERLFELHGSSKWRTDSWLLQTELLPQLNDLVAQLDQLVENQERGIAAASDQLLIDAHNATQWSLWITVIGLLSGILVSWLITRSISAPLRLTNQAMAQVADGEGDLTKRLDVHGRDEISELATSFNSFIGHVEDIVSQTAKTTGGVIQGVATTNDRIGQIADRLVQQQTETDQVATAVTEMLASIADVAGSASQADTAANQAADEARKGQKTVAETANGIHALAERLVGASQLVDRLEADSQSIRGVADVIRGITEQINLLALNAAIEAARAGEHGRGFAVVAEEVRSLATRTHHSTAEIEEMVSRLNHSAAEAVGLMASGKEMAESNAEQARDSMTALSAIESSVDTISSLNGQIAVAVGQQRTVLEDIHRAIEHISEAGQDNSNEADGARQAAVRLGDLIADLQHLVDRFHVHTAGFDFDKARNAHMSWRVRVRSFLDGEGSLTTAEAVSHRDCELGKWFYGDGLARYGDLPQMRAIESPHERLHGLIKEIIELKHDGAERKAEQRYAELEELSHAIVAALNELEASVARQPAGQAG